MKFQYLDLSSPAFIYKINPMRKYYQTWEKLKEAETVYLFCNFIKCEQDHEGKALKGM